MEKVKKQVLKDLIIKEFNVKSLDTKTRETDHFLARVCYYTILNREFDLNYANIGRLSDKSKDTIRYNIVSFESLCFQFPKLLKKYNKIMQYKNIWISHDLIGNVEQTTSKDLILKEVKTLTENILLEKFLDNIDKIPVRELEKLVDKYAI